jgi:hypothetical protein
VTFSDFELLLPRKMFRNDDVYIYSSGAELFIDKRPSSRVAGLAQFEKVDYRTTELRLDPGDSHTDFFDLAASSALEKALETGLSLGKRATKGSDCKRFCKYDPPIRDGSCPSDAHN